MSLTPERPEGQNTHLTFGERRVRVNFNPSANKEVEAFKRMAADFIDVCEQKSAAIQEANPVGWAEVVRLYSLAMTHAEDAAMWAVKAATA